MASEIRIAQLQSMLEKEPNDLFLNYALGLEFAKDLLDPKSAEKQYHQVLQLNPDYLPAFYQLGQLFEQTGKIAEALNFYKTGLEKARLQKNNKAINEFGEAVFMLEDE